MHEVIFSDKRQQKFGVHTLDIAKRLIDYGFHPMTIYFPLVVPGAMMIEPTESEGREELDLFIDAMSSIAREARKIPSWSNPLRTIRASEDSTKRRRRVSPYCGGRWRLRERDKIKCRFQFSVFSFQ